MNVRLTALAVGSLIWPSALLAQIPAFSGADGAAASVTGGRGGLVYHVTKLDSAIDDPERNDFGTLRYGLNNANFPAGPRTIVFDIGGVFHLGRLPQPQNGWDPNGNGWDAQSRLTIGGSNVTFAGQTAPGKGVIFMGGGLKPQGNNNIIRNVTVAAGYGMRNWWDPGDTMPTQPPANPPAEDLGHGFFPDSNVYDAMDIAGTNIMIDHVSALYATDESISMNEVANNITVQYSSISQGQNYPNWDGGFTGHAMGSLLEAGNSSAQAAISFHHNLYAHQKSRVPQLQSKTGSLGAFYDFRNNVFYNWFGTAGTKSGTTSLNLVNNFYLAGPGGDQPVGGNSTSITTQAGGTGVLSASSTIYRNGNLLDSNKDGDANDGAALSTGGAASPLWKDGVVTYAGTTDTAAQTFDRVLNYMGANWWTRGGAIDTPDERIINEARTGAGKIMAWADDPWNNSSSEGLEWRTLKDTPAESRDVETWDTEASVGYGIGDGMPTYWELQHNLDPNARDDTGDFDGDGYTNLEEYLNDVAAWPAPNSIKFNNANSDGRFAHILNWDANPDAALSQPWQPSRYDTAIIDGGTVVLDAVGQHAGNVLLGTGAGNNVTLNITSGWLKVEDAPFGLSNGMTVIGDNPAATATLNLSGGTLVTKTLLKGAGDTFNFTGGILSAETIGFSLDNFGGTLAPGNSPGSTTINGDFTTHSGELEIELANGSFDSVTATGNVTVGGDLVVKLLDGFLPGNEDSFAIIMGSTTGGTFANVAPNGRVNIDGADGSFLVTIGAGQVTLSDFYIVSPVFAGDYDDNGVVNAADYALWRKFNNTATTLANDSTPGTDATDYEVWRAHFGQPPGNGAGAANAAVPEPGTSALIIIAILAACFRRGAIVS